MNLIEILRPTKDEIARGISHYNSIITNSADLTTAFSHGNWFQYFVEDFPLSSAHIHAYPAILGGQLLFFMIPSVYDNAAYGENIEQYVQMCAVSVSERSNRITSQTALHRIHLWKEDYAMWIPNQVHREAGMFRAFQIDSVDFETPVVEIALALRTGRSPESHHLADLIVVNDKGKAIVYDDFVRPVPPYGPSAAASNFYLFQV